MPLGQTLVHIPSYLHRLLFIVIVSIHFGEQITLTTV
jgi:hypothetical protein